MNEYVEWMQKCVNGAFHPEISIQSFNGYGSALFWQILFFLTIILTSIIVPTIICGPFVGPIIWINLIVKKLKNQVMKVVPECLKLPDYLKNIEDTDIQYIYVSNDKKEILNKLKLPAIKKIHAILLGTTLLFQFLLLPFVVSGERTILAITMTVFFWIIFITLIMLGFVTLWIFASGYGDFGFWQIAKVIVCKMDFEHALNEYKWYKTEKVRGRLSLIFENSMCEEYGCIETFYKKDKSEKILRKMHACLQDINPDCTAEELEKYMNEAYEKVKDL